MDWDLAGGTNHDKNLQPPHYWSPSLHLNLGLSLSTAHSAPSEALGSPPGRRRPPVSNPSLSFHPAHSIQTLHLTPPPPSFPSRAVIPPLLTYPAACGLRPGLCRPCMGSSEPRIGHSSSGTCPQVA